MIDEEEIKKLHKLSRNDLARFVSKQNENELNALREEIQRLREEIETLKKTKPNNQGDIINE